MNELLYRLAWMVSLACGYICTALFSLFGYKILGWRMSSLSFYVISTTLFSLIMKKVFLPKHFIDRQIAAYKTSVTPAPPPLDIGRITSPVQEPTLENELSEPVSFSGPAYAPTATTAPDPVFVETIDTESEPSLNTPPVMAWSDSPSEETSPVSQSPSAPPTQASLPKKILNVIQRFFSENVLAKMGGILLFLGVLFLLKQVYGAIGPVGKLIIGFTIGFVIYGLGLFLEKKKLTAQSHVLIGLGILINYLVILAGRFLIGDGIFTDRAILTEGVTFFLLVFNTVLAVTTSIIYHSRALLFFAFAIAYLNPFLINADASSRTPFTLVGYGMIVSLGALFLSRFQEEAQNRYRDTLLTMAFLGGSILFIIAPFGQSFEWLIKLAALGILTILILIAVFKSEHAHRLGWYFLGGYLFAVILLGYGQANLFYKLQNTGHLIGFFLFLMAMVAAGVSAFVATSALFVFATLMVPLIILPGMVLAGMIPISGVLVVPAVLLAGYIGIFIFISGFLTRSMQYAFFIVLGVFAGLMGAMVSPIFKPLSAYHIYETIPAMTSAMAICISAFIFQLSAYCFSTRKGLSYLYSLGSGMGIFMLLTFVQREGELVGLSVGSIFGFMTLNLVLPFVNRSLLAAHIRNLIFGLIAGVLFLSGEIFYFGDIYFSGVQIGLAFLLEAMFYFGMGYAMFIKMKAISSQNAKDVVYAMLGISISLFSLAIAFVFSRHAEVVSAIWIFEAGLILFFFWRGGDLKVYAAGMLLMAVGLWKLFDLINRIRPKEFLSLVPLTIIAAALVVMLKFMEHEKRNFRWLHDGGHLIGIGLIVILIMRIIPSHGHGMSIIGAAVGSVLLSVVYSTIFSAKIKHCFVFGLIFFFMFQIFRQNAIEYRLRMDHITYMIVLQYMATGLLGGTIYLFNRFLKQRSVSESDPEKWLIVVLNSAFAMYLFIITTQYTYHLSGYNRFAITIYWGLLTFALLSYGILKDVLLLRTAGLYILIFAVAKILLFDVWIELENAVVRILALMLVGGVMISISILYQKKINGNLKAELNLKQAIRIWR